MTTTSPIVELESKFETLKTEFPAVTFGYLGNCERWGDDRYWFVFLPHPGRIGTRNDSVGGYKTADLDKMLANWDRIVADVRKMMEGR